jgi:hypothetical protein
LKFYGLENIFPVKHGQFRLRNISFAKVSSKLISILRVMLFKGTQAGVSSKGSIRLIPFKCDGYDTRTYDHEKKMDQ